MARAPGIPNRRKQAFRDALRKYMHDRNIDPHHFMVDMLADNSTTDVVASDGTIVHVPNVPMQLKFMAAKELAQYVEPKIRMVEIHGPDGGALIVQQVQYAMREDGE